jgi:deoxycytidylate deaminase
VSRPTWSDTYFALAHVWAQRGTCDRLRAGCVFVNRDHLVVAADALADQVETMLAAAGIPLRGPHQETDR